ncbi:MAG: DUF4835 family protein [Bacteroidota bacterium]
MRFIRPTVLVFALLLSFTTLRAGEFQATVSVRGDQSIANVDPMLFQDMQKQLTEYMNNTRFTDYVFEPYERLNCQITIVFNGQSGGFFTGDLNVRLIRPVLNSNYETLLYRFVDTDFEVEYTQFQQLQYSEQNYVDNLTAILNFHALIMLGLDFEAMGRDGGAPFFERARNIAMLAAQSNRPGWRAMDSRDSRYWVMENLTNNSYKSMRDIYYRYHRKGLDAMADDLASGRSEIMSCMEDLQKLYVQNPNIYIIQVFLDTKWQELVKIMSGAFDDDKQRFLRIMQQIDPRRLDKYNQILEAESN